MFLIKFKEAEFNYPNDPKWCKKWFNSASAMQVFFHVLLGHGLDGDSEQTVLEPAIELPVKLHDIPQEEIQDTLKKSTTTLSTHFAKLEV